MANKTIQLLRNQNLYASHEAALTALQAKLQESTFDGQPILARYTYDNEERTLLGVKSANGYEIFDNQNASEDIQAAIDALNAEVTSSDGTNVQVKVTEVAGIITGVSIDTDNTINATDLSDAIADLDSSVEATAASGNVYSVLTGVTQTDGVLTGKTEVTLAAAAKTGAAADVSIADSGDNFTSTNVEGALAELAAKTGDISVGSLDKTVTVQTATGAAFGTDLSVNIDGTTLVKDAFTGVISSDLKIVKNSSPSDTSVKEEYYLAYGSSSTAIGDTIKIYKDSALLSIKLLHAYHVGQADEILPTYSNGTWTDIDSQYQTEENVALCYAYSDATGATVIAAVPVGDFLQESEFGDGLQVVSGEVSVKIDNTGEFLSVSSDGVKVSGISAAITNAIDALDLTTDVAVAGKYVAAIEEANGVVGVKTRADVAAAPLNGYAKGTDATAVAATDTVNQAISKLENQVDKAKSAATTVVAEGTDAGNNMSIAETAGADGHKIFTINLTDVASATALTNEIAARKAVDGQSGDTYTANAGANYIASATSLNDADVRLDAALKTADDAMLTGVAAGNGISVSAKSGKSQTITAVAATNDPIIEVTANGIATKENAVYDCGTY